MTITMTTVTCKEPVGIGWSWAPCDLPASHYLHVDYMPRSNGPRCLRHTCDWQDILVATASPTQWSTTPLWAL